MIGNLKGFIPFFTKADLKSGEGDAAGRLLSGNLMVLQNG